MKYSFTLVELVVVIAIIGILGTSGIFSYKAAIENAQKTKMRVDLKDIGGMVDQVRISQGIVFGLVTGNFCTECSCRGRNTKTDAGCISVVTASWNNILSKSGLSTGSRPVPKDPWGGVYIWDENEQEGGANDCRPDLLYSAGPDNIWVSADDAYSYSLSEPIACENYDWTASF